MTSNYGSYSLLKDDDPEEECKDWFWCNINLDDTYPKEFLEYLHQMVDDIESGKVKTYTLDEVMEELRNGEED